ncbi:MAG: UDP-3-O-[3-hydroxymyristoyl] N-acetylglucosamine deacetylase [Elusimicrobia bacterium]|nr:UDP-3-O-[3-hydroxymyristoyl] N-acetylglucosamine deacetylase [Elusimicrobiota bacterium]
MSKDFQHTIKNPLSISGIGIHSGVESNLRFLPAEPGEGIVFVRTDLEGSPSVPALVDYVVDVSRGTTIQKGDAIVHTVEHLLSAASGLGIDNLVVEIDSIELPIGDGSAEFFSSALLEAGIKKQDAEREYFIVEEPIFYSSGGSELAVFPADKFTISATIQYSDKVLGTQFLSIDSNKENFLKGIAPARTFCFEAEIELLKKMGLGKGGNFNNTIVVGEEDIINTELRFDDEFVRHKILDLIGDLYLLGMPIKGSVIANRCGHAANVEFVKKLKENYLKRQYSPSKEAEQVELPDLMKILPHRYPFLLVDRIIVEPSKKIAYGYKNITVNEPFFKGHFPDSPVFPRVLLIEFIAQSSALMLLSDSEFKEKLAYFIVIDHAKFFGDARPPDMLSSRVELKRARGSSGKVAGVCYVGDRKIAEAEFMFSIVDK